MNKDYIKDYQPEEDQIKEFSKLKKLRSRRNPMGRDRKNMLDRDFESDASIRRDQALKRFRNIEGGSGESWSPHDYL